MKVTDEMLKEAKDWGLFESNKNTVYQGSKDAQNEFQIAGNLGEMKFKQMYLKAQRISNVDYEADFIVNHKRIDVKTKLGNYECKDFYNVDVQAHQKYYNVDWYVFFHYNRKKKELQYLGGITKEDYFKDCKFVKKGDVFNNGHVVQQDQYELPIRQLKK